MTCGNYSLVVSGFNTSTGNYTVSAREVQGSISTYSRIPTPNPGQTAQRTGDLHANGDQDYHRITLTAGHLYRFNLNSRNFGCGALADPYLEIRNSNGARVPLSAGGPGTTGQGGFVQDDDSGPGLNSQLSFRPTTSGTYYVNARAYNNASTGGYNISVSRQPVFQQPMIA